MEHVKENRRQSECCFPVFVYLSFLVLSYGERLVPSLLERSLGLRGIWKLSFPVQHCVWAGGVLRGPSAAPRPPFSDTPLMNPPSSCTDCSF